MDNWNSRLQEAVQFKDLERAREALRHGADPNGVFHDDNHTALFWAAFSGQGELVGLLLDAGATVSAELASDSTSLHVTAEAGDLPMVTLLLAADGSCALNVFDYMGYTPLMYAVREGKIQVARLLLEMGADVNVHDEQQIGPTALMVAVEKSNNDLRPDIIELLLQAGADPLIAGWMQTTPLDQVRRRQKPEGLRVAAMLEQAVKRRNGAEGDSATKQGNTRSKR
jgi:ankyrin repeat protein